MKKFRFERLAVWQAARALNHLVDERTRPFPASERFGLTSQRRRASISISSNIAGGAGRNSARDFAHYLEQADGSAMEVASQVFLAFDEGYLKPNDADELLTSLSALAGQNGALHRALKVAPSKVKLPGVETDATHPLRHRAE